MMEPTTLTHSPWLRLVLRGAHILDGPSRRLLRLSAPNLLEAARRRTHLHDFGDPAPPEPLKRLVQSVEDEARLTFIGRVAAREDLTHMLMNRLKMERDRQQYPDIAAEQIRRPLFITGLPRTGSTFLHGLLAQDPTNCVPLHWEIRDPSPPPEQATYETDPRIERAARQVRWFFRLTPEFRKIHSVGSRLPEECTVILSHTFLSSQFSSTWCVPSYQAWLEQQDLLPVYRYHRQFLQHLQWHCPRQRWVLKAPLHLPGLCALYATYPDANIIVLHRDPLEVVASVASLHVTLRRTFSDAVDPLAVGPEVTRMLAEDIRRGFEARDAACVPAEQVVDVWYAQLLHEPLDVVRRIYRQFELPLTAEAEARMHRYLGRNLKDHYGPHVYSLAQFGLDHEVERERYRAYSQRWGAPAETC